MECWQLQLNRVEEVCKLNISLTDLMRKKMKANLNESSRFQLNRTEEKTTEKRLLTTSNRATIVCTYEEQHKLAAQKTFFLLGSRQMKKKSSTFLLRLLSTIYSWI